MTATDQLLSDLQNAIEKKDAAKFKAAKMRLNGILPNTPETVRIKYRYAMYFLHQEKNLEDTTRVLKEIMTKGVLCDDFLEARISYALCLWNSDKKQQAIFELRKVLSNQKSANIHTTMALDYLTMFLKESNAPDEAVQKAFHDRIQHLTELSSVKHAADANLGAQLRIRLAAALEERNGAGDKAQALAIFSEVAKLGSQLSKENLNAAQDAVKRLSKK